MSLTIKPKFKLNDIVQVFERKKISSVEVVCPFCEGNYRRKNPLYDSSISIEEQTCFEYVNCASCHEGKFAEIPRYEDVLSDIKYIVTAIYANITETEHKFSYQLRTGPEISDNSKYNGIFTVKEDDIILALPSDAKIFKASEAQSASHME